MKFNLKEFLYVLLIFLILFLEFDFNQIFPIELELRKYIQILILFFSIILLIVNQFKVSYTIFYSSSFRVFLFFLVLMAVVTKNSVNIGVTISAVLGLFVMLFSCLVISSSITLKSIVVNFLYVSFFIILISFILYIFIPNLVRNNEEFYRFKGLFIHSQRYSLLLCTVIIVFYKFRYYFSKLFYFILMVICLISLYLTLTRSFTTFLIFSFCLIYYFEDKINFKFLFFASVILFFGFLILDGLHIIDSFFVRDDRDLTELTGRTIIWQETIERSFSKPVFGHGFGTFRISEIGPLNWFPEHAHNLWIHQFYEIGFFGLFVFNSFIFSCVYLSFKFLKFHRTFFSFYLLVFYLLGSITGLVFGGLSTPFYYFILIFNFSEIKSFKLDKINSLKSIIVS